MYFPPGLGELDLLGDLGGLSLGGPPVGAAPVGAAPVGGGGIFGAPTSVATAAPGGLSGLGGLGALGGGLDIFGGIPTAAGSGFYTAPKAVSGKIKIFHS